MINLLQLYANIGSRLLKERQARGLAVGDMAELVQTPMTVYKQIEDGACIYSYPLTLATAMRIVSALGWSLDYLCGLTQQKAPLPADTGCDAKQIPYLNDTTAEGGAQA